MKLRNRLVVAVVVSAALLAVSGRVGARPPDEPCTAEALGEAGLHAHIAGTGLRVGRSDERGPSRVVNLGARPDAIAWCSPLAAFLVAAGGNIWAVRPDGRARRVARLTDRARAIASSQE